MALIDTARNLADALSDYAYTRKDDDRKRVTQLQHELCQERKKELSDEQRPE